MMKRKLHIIFICIITLIAINKVNAESQILTFDHLKNYDVDNISNINSYKDGYIYSTEVDNNTIVYSYDNNDILKSSKQLDDFIKTSFIKFNDNYLVVGLNNNTLKLYLLDTNLQIKKQLKTTYIIGNSSNISLYSHNDKIYAMLTEDGILSSNNLYEIDENLNIKEEAFSSLGAENLYEILKGDYYLVRFNSDTETEELRDKYYLNSTYIENKYILVGLNYNELYDEPLDSNYEATLTILDKNGNILINEINNNYYCYNSVEIVKDKIVVLAYNGNYYLVVYDFDGKLISEDKISIDSLNIDNMYKVGNKIILSLSDTENSEIHKSSLVFYNYNLTIYTEESLFGTIKIKSSSIPYEKVEFEALANSGYEIDNILVKDTQGNIIKVSGQSFIMPENDVTLTINFKEIVTNPETIDYIIIIFPILIIVSLIMINLYRKISWLK